MRFQRLYRDERGMSVVFVGLGFMGFLAATTLAVDVGMLMTARTQAQTAADAGALAGAVALTFNDYNDRTSSGPAVQSAINAALANTIVGAPPSVGTGDVQFINDPSGTPTRVQVQVFRSTERNNAVPTLMGSFFGLATADINATATAETVSANAAKCVAPFAIPDKWREMQTGSWDTSDTFNAFPTNPSQFGDIYRAADLANYTGYKAAVDRGLQITLRPSTGANPQAGTYTPITLEGSNPNAADFITNVDSCNDDVMGFGETLNAQAVDTASMKTAMDALIAQDPSAYWDTSANKVVSTMSPSPRVRVVPVFDPLYWNQGKQQGHTADLKASNYIGLFIESVDAMGNVTARITPVTGTLDSGAGAAPTGSFARVIRLVQ
jgi:Flp pilus assembly protein TadG